MTPPTRWLVVEAREASGEPGEEDGRLAEALLALGGRAVQESDGWLVTHLDPASPAVHAAHAATPKAIATRLGELSGLSAVEVRTAWQDHEDWAELWKRGLAPRRIGRRLVVTPSWCTPEVRPGDLVLVLDPGMAFGNAEHGTTRGCLRLMEGVVRQGDRILDVGAGSGVLSIAAARLGAASVQALEADPWAVGPARENAEANGVADRVRVLEVRADAAALARFGPHDGVVANIEAGVLGPLLPGLAAAVAPHGWLLLSGLLPDQLDVLVPGADVLGFHVEEVDRDGEWRSALFRR